MDLVVVAEATALPIRSSLPNVGNTTVGGEQAASSSRLLCDQTLLVHCQPQLHSFCACDRTVCLLYCPDGFSSQILSLPTRPGVFGVELAVTRPKCPFWSPNPRASAGVVVVHPLSCPAAQCPWRGLRASYSTPPWCPRSCSFAAWNFCDPHGPSTGLAPPFPLITASAAAVCA